MEVANAIVILFTCLYTARGLSKWFWYDLLGRGRWCRFEFTTHSKGRLWRHRGELMPPSKLTDALQDFWTERYRK